MKISYRIQSTVHKCMAPVSNRTVFAYSTSNTYCVHQACFHDFKHRTVGNDDLSPSPKWNKKVLSLPLCAQNRLWPRFINSNRKFIRTVRPTTSENLYQDTPRTTWTKPPMSMTLGAGHPTLWPHPRPLPSKWNYYKSRSEGSARPPWRPRP